MQTASQVREALKALRDLVSDDYSEELDDATHNQGMRLVAQADAALAALSSEPIGDGDAEWLRSLARHIAFRDTDAEKKFNEVADRLTDCDRLRVRVKELEGAIASIEPLSVRTLATGERIHVIARADALLAARSALPPAAPQ